MALRSSGYKVMIIEKSQHPRFAIGESSTPIADMILRDLAEEYKLPVLAKLSRYGNWQKHYPEVMCGLKRGFSYYLHQPNEVYYGDTSHKFELLVAASADDINSDTNWFRSDTDQFLAREAEKTGARLFEKAEVISLKRDQLRRQWSAVVEKEGQPFTVQADWIIDATGSSRFSEKFLDTQSSSAAFRTDTSALFSHFNNVPYWLDALTENKSEVAGYPYHPDHSALHQVLEEGWLWMLRFNSGLLSSGLVFDNHTESNSDLRREPPAVVWNRTLEKYPSLNTLFKDAHFADEPGRLIATGRLQRKLNQAGGDGWFALPHTVGFVDPMHSTGIAHTLTGVERLLSFFKSIKGSTDVMQDKEKADPDRGPESANFMPDKHRTDTDYSQETTGLKRGGEAPDIRIFRECYQKDLFAEIDLIDELVSICYRTRRHFKLFHSSVMLYFIATLHYEGRRLTGQQPKSFLGADNLALRRTIREAAAVTDHCLQKGAGRTDIEVAWNKIRQIIAPYNTVGLMDPDKRNLYTHTAVMFDEEQAL